ncbi:hypothetical protein N7495_006611 [Penicillium taxi]|uniref:uncharacterized protein n=1 Tax=Penicillium taxi TaxID=168475 RepID=UPI00254572E9|nr:uncharacterized protein N7495_006611 [Penicillium taxi]KAJ5894920.1 hypothetical protein N7495_006611 [Penicillium taxi]
MDLKDAFATTGFVTHALRHPIESFLSIGPTLNEATVGLAGSYFKPERDIGSLKGKVILVTGGNAGIGKETILQLAKHEPACIYLAARTESKAKEAIESIRAKLSTPIDIRYLPLDLSSFKSIRAAAEQFQADTNRLDLLILNAGTMGNPATKTEDGFEIQLGTNHVGHFLMTKLLLPTLQHTVMSARESGSTPDVRVVTLSSVGHVVCPTSFEEMTSTSSLLEASTWTRYGASKGANILFAAELSRRYPEIMSVAVHPGVVKTPLYDHVKYTSSYVQHTLSVVESIFFRNVASGALNSLWAATAPLDNLSNGAYYTPVGNRSKGTAFVRRHDIAKKLWEWTEDQIAERS